jgi:hypothetical protein
MENIVKWIIVACLIGVLVFAVGELTGELFQPPTSADAATPAVSEPVSINTCPYVPQQDGQNVSVYLLDSEIEQMYPGLTACGEKYYLVQSFNVSEYPPEYRTMFENMKTYGIIVPPEAASSFEDAFNTQLGQTGTLFVKDATP